MTTTRYFVDAESGRYLGGFAGAEPPSGVIEVDAPPERGADLWVNGAWQPDAASVIAESRAATDATELSTAKAAPATSPFLNRTPAQVDNWIDLTAVDLVGVRIVLKLMARILMHVARRGMR